MDELDRKIIAVLQENGPTNVYTVCTAIYGKKPSGYVGFIEWNSAYTRCANHMKSLVKYRFISIVEQGARGKPTIYSA